MELVFSRLHPHHFRSYLNKRGWTELNCFSDASCFESKWIKVEGIYVATVDLKFLANNSQKSDQMYGLSNGSEALSAIAEAESVPIAFLYAALLGILPESQANLKIGFEQIFIWLHHHGWANSASQHSGPESILTWTKQTGPFGWNQNKIHVRLKSRRGFDQRDIFSNANEVLSVLAKIEKSDVVMLALEIGAIA